MKEVVLTKIRNYLKYRDIPYRVLSQRKMTINTDVCIQVDMSEEVLDAFLDKISTYVISIQVNEGEDHVSSNR